MSPRCDGTTRNGGDGGNRNMTEVMMAQRVTVVKRTDS